HGIMLLLGATRAEESIALFLLGLSKQFTARKHSGIHFPLPMTRQEIGNYLGLTIETVSRIFSYFNEVQLIAINGRDVEIKNVAHLQQVIGERRRQRQAVPNQLTGGLGIPIFNRT
ncbi:MAG TPA: helix-turn-helix domain-containing protein, partial [Burkholderiales bacterium]|nr:helix-turn-helix domain-containing protein [Burkholderiales bacterium]